MAIARQTMADMTASPIRSSYELNVRVEGRLRLRRGRSELGVAWGGAMVDSLPYSLASK